MPNILFAKTWTHFSDPIKKAKKSKYFLVIFPHSFEIKKKYKIQQFVDIKRYMNLNGLRLFFQDSTVI